MSDLYSTLHRAADIAFSDKAGRVHARDALLVMKERFAADWAAGRAPDAIGIESWLTIRDRSPGDWLERIAAWKGLGATHLTLDTMGSGFSFPPAGREAPARDHVRPPEW